MPAGHVTPRGPLARDRTKAPLQAKISEAGEHVEDEPLRFGPRPPPYGGCQQALSGLAGLERVTPHDCRHTYASLMIDAGVNVKALSSYMGHANISITLDRYAHMMPGNEEQAAGLLDAYLTKVTG